MIEGKIKITGIERKEIRFIEIEGGDREAMMIVSDVIIEDMILEKEGATKIQKIIKEGEAMIIVIDVIIEDMSLEKEGDTKVQKNIKEGEAMTLKSKKEI